MDFSVSSPWWGSSPSVFCILGDDDSTSESRDSLEEAMAPNRKVTVTAQALDKSSKSSDNLKLDKLEENNAAPVEHETTGTQFSLFQDNKNQNQGLELGILEYAIDDVVLEAHDSDDVLKAWGFCLIGYFATRLLGKQALLKLCDSWGIEVPILYP